MKDEDVRRRAQARAELMGYLDRRIPELHDEGRGSKQGQRYPGVVALRQAKLEWGQLSPEQRAAYRGRGAGVERGAEDAGQAS